MVPAGSGHSISGVRIAAQLFSHVNANNLGRVFGADAGFLLARDQDTLRDPDVAFVRRERVEAVGIPSGYWPGAPDLAIGIISPNDRYTEVYEKVDEWLEAGVGMVVVVNPRNRSATVRIAGMNPVILNEGDTLDGGEVAPRWRMADSDIFA